MKSLFQNIGLAVFLNLGIKSAWILANNEVQDRIGNTGFGLYLALYSAGFLFLALADMGLNQYTTKALAHEPERLRKLFPNLLSLKITFSSLYPFFMIGVGWLLGYRDQELLYLFLLCIVHAILQVNFFFRANFQAFQKFRIDAVASVLDRLIMLAIVLVLLLTEISVEDYIWAYLASAAISMVILYALILRMFGFIRPGWSKQEVRQVLKLSFPFAVITVLYSVNDKVDQVMLERILGGDVGKHETGVYGAAYRWVDTAMMYLWTVLPIFFAKFAKHTRSSSDLSKLLAFGQPIAAIPMIFTGVWALFYGEHLFFQYENQAADIPMMTACARILFISVLINGYFAIYSTLLTSTNHERFVSWMIGVSIVMNVALNAIFIPEYGAIASAWTTVASFGLLSVSYIWYIHFRLPVRLPYSQLLRLLLAGGVFALAFWGMDRAGLAWYLTSALGGILLLGLTYALGLIKLQQQLEEES